MKSTVRLSRFLTRVFLVSQDVEVCSRDMRLLYFERSLRSYWGLGGKLSEEYF